ncbi:hypothetical protein GGD81_002827 [Rhodobium orientis]|uniref:hypothetical protein n=1 Tax=Rhodobium orientis TaxID=34017 RepID=UPI0011B94492|nr:hypothetical protein [Rhodobium orientis]MBB4303775.1 hypothetical protein [Rhodobium orientis]
MPRMAQASAALARAGTAFLSGFSGKPPQPKLSDDGTTLAKERHAVKEFFPVRMNKSFEERSPSTF